MSDLNTRATVTLQVNGQQAEQTLQHLKNNALQLESAIAKAAAAGNKTDLKRLRKELTDTKRQIREIESSTMQVEHVLSRLDRATPKELSRTLATLNRQLDYMERGSKAWNAHVEKIKLVKAEIAAVNDELRNQEGFWTRFNRTMNDWQTTIMGAAAAVTGLIMAGRAAVNAYAEMDAEMANVRKFTGMEEEQVKELNEEFKKIDTRTGREELNQLAQEAGRLGKSSQEDVLGFVRAADQINVALDDLGDGATLVLSKLGTIFGDEKRLGTERALLSIGSVINELSQNCTASAPYLAQFAQRMAGVGAQANMTIPQIMGFAAVLDSQGQAVEMSATALSKLIMDMFKQQDQIVKATGLNAEKFNEALKRSTNEGLLMLIERLHDLGNIDVLAPVFKDMGENGARAAQVISALAGNLEMVKWEQEEAAKAFEEGTSVTEEFNVQNNTVQAGLDKARKGVTELAVELGEKLLPIMKHVYSSTSLTLRLLSAIVDFVIKYKGEIITLTAAVVAYNVVLKATAIWQKAVNAYIIAGEAITNGYTSVVKTLTAAKIALRVILAKLQNNWAKQSSAMADAKMAGVSLTNGYAALAAALVVVGAAIYSVIKRQIDHRKELERQKKEAQEYAKAASDLSQKTADNSAKEIAALKTLYEQAVREANSKDLRRQAVEKLQALYPAYFKNMSAEEIMVGKAKGKYDELCKSILAVAKARAAAEKIEENMKDILTMEGELENGEVWLKNATKRVEKAQADYDKAVTKTNEANSAIPSFADPKDAGVVMRGNAGAIIGDKGEELSRQKSNRDAAQRYVDARRKKIATLNAANEKLANTYGSQEGFDLSTPEVSFTPATTTVTTPDPSADGGDGNGSSAAEDKFAKEKAWREREEALNRIAYAKGEKDYEAYTNRMNEIAVEFYARELQHTDLSEDERLKIEADYYEAQKKEKEVAAKLINDLSEKELKEMADAEEFAYQDMLAAERQRYIDGQIDQKTFEEASKLLELEHLRTMTLITAEGTKERQSAVAAYQSAIIEDQKKRQEESERLAREHQDALKKIKKDVFGMNPAERQAAYRADLALLQEVYNLELLAAADNAKEKLRIEKAFQKAKLALMEEYNIEGAETNKNFLSEWNDDVMDFLNSDLGQAVSGAVDTLVSGMSSIFQQLTTIVQAELEIQQASINKRYDAEISLAEGNNFKINKLEKQRQAELAKAKKEANKKMFAMQVIQAVAQTAQAAINAYSSAAAIPVAGWVLAPIAAGMAVAAGALQIAAIKKQQQASEAQGYKSGGFTPDGAEDEVAGVVHAGEWVASQKLVKDPKTRPILEALDYAQRTNTIGSLSAEDVSSSITAPAVLAKSASLLSSVPQRIVVDNSVDNSSSNSTMKEVAEVIGSLKQRLDEPFITVNSVTGETGMKQAQDEYERLIRNKTPKSRR